MDLSSTDNEMAWHWLIKTVEVDPDKDLNLVWRVDTTFLYMLYGKFCKQAKQTKIPIEDIWGLIQIKWPCVTIVGSKGNRAYTAMRIK